MCVDIYIYIYTCIIYIYTLNPVKAIKTWSLKAGSHNESNDTKRVVNALDCKHSMLHLMLSDATQRKDRI